jgi:hypothetical protein
MIIITVKIKIFCSDLFSVENTFFKGIGDRKSLLSQIENLGNRRGTFDLYFK